jgi:hypothetical protein
LKHFDKVLSLLLIAPYLLLQCFPGSGAFFVGNADYLVNGLVDLFSVAGSDYNASLVEDFLKMSKIARHVILPPPNFLSVIASEAWQCLNYHLSAEIVSSLRLLTMTVKCPKS